MRHGFNLSDTGMRNALYGSQVMWEFAGIDMGEEVAPDEKTILKFRHFPASSRMWSALLQLDQIKGQVACGAGITCGEVRIRMTVIGYRGLYNNNASHLFDARALLNPVLANRRLLQT